VEAKTSVPRRGHSSGLAAAPRNITVVLASAGVLALLVLYAIAAPTASLSASVGPVVPQQGSNPVVLGRVLGPGGGGVAGASIEVGRAGGARLLATTTSNTSGTFRVELPGRCGAYEISIEARAEGATARTSSRRRLCPGDALPIDARVKTQGHFVWVPGPR
jgi:Carboxypeptidase regulatory-like domain